MAEVKKHIENQMKLLATERIKQLLEKVQPGGFRTRAVEYLEDFHLDISELCNWCRLYFGENMRPHFEPNLEEGIELFKEAKAELRLSEKLLKEANPLIKVEGLVPLDESVDDNFKERVRNNVDDDGEWMTWSQLNTKKPLANNQRLQALGLLEKLHQPNRNPEDYDYLVQEGNVVKFRPTQSRAEPEESKGTVMPWRDLNVEQAEVARTMVTKALKINPTIRDLAMHNYTVEDGKVTGLEFNFQGGMESIL